MSITIAAPPPAPNRITDDPATFHSKSVAFVDWQRVDLYTALKTAPWINLNLGTFSNPILNGTPTGTALASSATDTTAGKLLRTGDGGLLGLAPTVSAANALDAIAANMRVRVLSANVATVNGPSGAGAGVCDTYAFGVGNLFQVYREVTAAGGADFRTFTRGYESSVWTAWTQNYERSSVVGTVSQSGGVPTGAIIETGTDYTKWADGTMICTVTSGTLTSSNVTGSSYQSDAVSINFPQTFVAAPMPMPAATRVAGTIGHWVGNCSTSTTSANVRLMTSTSGATGTITVTAYGRWF